MSVLFLLIVVGLIIPIAFFIMFLSSTKIRRKQSTETTNDDASLSFDSMNIYRPIRSLRAQIIETVETSKDPAVRAMAGPVLEELNIAFARVVQALETRDQLRKAIGGHESIQTEIDRLLDMRNKSESPQEKLNYTKAYEAKINEQAETEKARTLIKKIEHEVELTKASFSELKTKLAVSGASINATDRADDLRSTLSSLEVMQSSVNEAQEMLRS